MCNLGEFICNILGVGVGFFLVFYISCSVVWSMPWRYLLYKQLNDELASHPNCGNLESRKCYSWNL